MGTETENFLHASSGVYFFHIFIGTYYQNMHFPVSRCEIHEKYWYKVYVKAPKT
jgi:hypothetical protein